MSRTSHSSLSLLTVAEPERIAEDRYTLQDVVEWTVTFVYKLIVAGSIEEKILALQEKKASLAESVLSADSAALSKFSEADIRALLAPLPAG